MIKWGSVKWCMFYIQKYFCIIYFQIILVIRSYFLKSAAFTGGRDTWLVFSKPNIMGPALIKPLKWKAFPMTVHNRSIYIFTKMHSLGLVCQLGQRWKIISCTYGLSRNLTSVTWFKVNAHPLPITLSNPYLYMDFRD